VFYFTVGCYGLVQNSFLREMFVGERKAIVIFPHLPLKSGSTFVRSFKTAKKSHPRSPIPLFPPLPFDGLAWHIRPNKFTSRTIRLLSRYIADLRFESLSEQVYKILEVITNGAHVSMTDAELS
jgi:hypothetical protein